MNIVSPTSVIIPSLLLLLLISTTVVDTKKATLSKAGEGGGGKKSKGGVATPILSGAAALAVLSTMLGSISCTINQCPASNAFVSYECCGNGLVMTECCHYMKPLLLLLIVVGGICIIVITVLIGICILQRCNRNRSVPTINDYQHKFMPLSQSSDNSVVRVSQDH